MATAAATGALVLALPPHAARAVNADHGARVVSTDPADHTPHVMDGAVTSVVRVAGKVVVAGTFTRVRQTLAGVDVTRNRIFAFDAATGRIDPSFAPALNGPVNSLDTDGTSVWAGGRFSAVGGVTSVKRVVKLTSGGALASGQPKVPNAQVNEVVVRGGRVYLGGKFSTVGGVPRAALAAVSATTGVVLPEVAVPFSGLFNGGGTGITRMDLSPDGRRLVAVGNFLSVAGQPREQIAVVETPPDGTATLSSWSTDRFSRARNTGCSKNYDSWMRDVDVAPDGSFFAVTTTGAYGGGAGAGALCDTTTRWESGRTGAGQQPTWVDYTGGDTTYGVAVTGSAIYVGGHMRWQNNPFGRNQAGPGAVAREGIAALDAVNGLPLSWDPGRARGVGAEAMYATPAGLWVGSDTDRIGAPREQHGRIAFLPLAGGTSVPSVPAATLPASLYLARPTGALQRRAVDSAGRPTQAAVTTPTTVDWIQVRGAFLVGGTLYYGRTDGALHARTFDGSTGAAGAERTVDLHDDPDTGERIPFQISALTGAFYDPATHRLYYTVAGDPRLLYRYFTPESEVVGAQQFVAGGAGQDLSRVAGMTLAGGRVLYGSSLDGSLRSIAFAGGQLTGSPTVVSADGSWNLRAILVPTA